MSDVSESSVSLGNLSLQPCIDKLSKAVQNDEKQLAKFIAAPTLLKQVHVLLETFSHKPQVTIREAVHEIVKELSRYGDSEEGKSEHLAEGCKQQGSKAFSQHHDQEALLLYNKALQLCPISSPNMALLYANRSAVLYHLQRYQDCLHDMSRAEQHCYPKRLRHKLLLRRAQCLLRISGHSVELRSALHKATRAAQALAKTDRQREVYLSMLGELQKELEESISSNVCNERVVAGKTEVEGRRVCLGDGSIRKDNNDVEHHLKLEKNGIDNEVAVVISDLSPDFEAIDLCSKDINKEIESDVEDYNVKIKEYNLLDGTSGSINCMSAALQLRENALEGRHIVSRCAIPKGSTLFVERPFASILLPQYHSTYCYNCIRHLSDMALPCRQCRVVVFCSSRCRHLAWRWHRLDCCRLTLTAAGGMAQLALRAVMVAGWPVCCAVMQENSSNSKKTGSTAKYAQYNSFSPAARYRALYNLVHHIDETPPEEQIQYCLASIILATALQNKLETLKNVNTNCSTRAAADSSSFHHMPEGWGTLEEVSALIYRHIGQLVCNGYAIYQVLAQQEQRALDSTTDEGLCGIESLSQERLASAIYATASLMNHSCQPTTINSYVGDLLVIRSISDVAAGDQVYSCYGPHYCRHTRADRSALLQQQYHFTCRCLPCTDPRYLAAERRWCGFLCESCGGLATFDPVPASASVPSKAPPSGNVEDGSGGEVLICHECGVGQPPSQRFKEQCSRAQELHGLGVAGMRQCRGSLQQAVQDLQAAVRLGSRIYCMDNQFLATMRDACAMVLAAQGLFKESAQMLHKYLKTAERRYGVDSVEVGHELVKYHRILQQQRDVTDSPKTKISLLEKMRSIESRIASIFSVCYGPTWQKILNIHL